MELVLLGFLCLLTSGPARSANKSLNLWWSPHEASPELEGFEIFEGDILIPKNVARAKNSINYRPVLWKNGIIPYEFDNFTDAEQSLVNGGIEFLERETCLDFVPRNEHYNFVRFKKAKSGCFAQQLLADSLGALIVNLKDEYCFKESTIMHELLHVTGLLHEQSRPDRDNYVSIHWCNIYSDRRFNFQKLSEHVGTDGFPYDYKSLLHYNNLAFSKNEKFTISAKSDPRKALGQQNGPTKLDIAKVNKMYNCKK